MKTEDSAGSCSMSSAVIRLIAENGKIVGKSFSLSGLPLDPLFLPLSLEHSRTGKPDLCSTCLPVTLDSSLSNRYQGNHTDREHNLQKNITLELCSNSVTKHRLPEVSCLVGWVLPGLFYIRWTEDIYMFSESVRECGLNRGIPDNVLYRCWRQVGWWCEGLV